MSTIGEQTLPAPVGRLGAIRDVLAKPRFWIYLSCAALAVLANYLLGKEMMWDTTDYHVYAGFSALHDRLGRDYFPAGVQSYLNPYVYVPFFLLARAGFPALWGASVLAIAQSGILWLTYELALAVSPPESPRLRVVAGSCAALLALANPILIDQLGSSFVDITTAEIVLAGWLLLVHALRMPSAARVVWAGLLLGCASALKLTNSLHALSACVILLFLPVGWRGKVRLSVGYAAALAVSFVAVAAPWALRLEQHFGNPFFPLFNNIFRSPHFPAVSLSDYRFLPGSLAEALWRPFASALPVTYVDDEFPSPDLRYALLITLGFLALLLWGWRRLRRAPQSAAAPEGGFARHGLVALVCAFLVDWTLWLRIAGNGRYFLAMACVAGVLGVALAFRIFAARPRVLGVALTVVFACQGLQLASGTGFRTSAPWDGRPWLDVSVPSALKETPDLYFLIGENSESFIAPFLGDGSAFVNLSGDYALGPGGANGARIRSLIGEYAGRIRVVAIASEYQLAPPRDLPELSHVDDTLAAFGLRADTTDCSTITARDVRQRSREVLPGTLPIRLPQMGAKMIRVPMSPDAYLVTCRVVSDPGSRAALANAEREPDLVFNRVEDECPRLFLPPRPVTEVYGDGHSGYRWVREYQGTNLMALITDGSVKLVDRDRGGRADMLGRESDWARAPVRLACGRYGERFHARVVSPAR